MELLRRDKYGSYDDEFPRSEVIQQLSVLLHELLTLPAAIGVGNGNFRMFAAGSTAFGKVLDKVLSPPPPVQNPEPDVTISGELEPSPEEGKLKRYAIKSSGMPT